MVLSAVMDYVGPKDAVLKLSFEEKAKKWKTNHPSVQCCWKEKRKTIIALLFSEGRKYISQKDEIRFDLYTQAFLCTFLLF